MTWVPTIGEAADLLQVGRSTLRRWRNTRTPSAPACLFVPGEGKRTWVHVDGLREWAESQGLLDRAPGANVTHLAEATAPSEAEAERAAQAAIAACPLPGGAAPAATAPPPPTPAAAPAAGPAPALTDEDRQALLRSGFSADRVDYLGTLSANAIRRLKAVADAEYKAAQAAQRALQNRKANGDLVERVLVEGWYSQVVSQLHDAIRSLPGKLSKRLHKADRATVYEVLEAELERTLAVVARQRMA